ncbi:MAG: alginate lyase family protein, partial [Lentisphaeria bacterium]|nr:alginate lyase family protein [Lentisphaeria bacterium]
DAKRPGFEAYRQALDAGKLEAAQRLLVKHFATRTTPFLPAATFPGLSKGNSTLILKGGKSYRNTADSSWMKHVFTLSNNDAGKKETFDLGPEIHWLENPSKSLSWILYLNQLNVVSQLAGVYTGTREEAYAREAADMVLSWTQQVHRGFGYVRQGKLVNSGMEVRNRLCNCIAAYEVLRSSPSLTPAHHMAFWKLFITCSRELMEYDGVSYPGLVAAAVLFPEFSEAGLWFETGLDDMRKHLAGRTTPEGAWDTHSIAYQTVPVPWAMRCLEIIDANPETPASDEVATMIRTQVGKLLEIMLRIAMPNLGLPNIGDTYGRYDWSGGEVTRTLKWYRHVRGDSEPVQGTDTYQLLKATLTKTDGEQGSQPAQASSAFPGTGYYVMRSGWQPKSALYLYADLSPQAIGHAHNDAGHFELYGYGKPLLTDTGDYFLGWGYRAALHNTIEVDGKDQARGAHAKMLPRSWSSTSAFDLFDGAHTAYANQGVSHRRRILFVKPDYFVLCDLLDSAEAHTYEQFFHFAGPIQTQGAKARIDDDTLVAETQHPHSANICVVPLRTEGLGAALVEARDTDMNIADKFTRDAMLGWIVTTGTFQRVKSDVAVYTKRGAGAQVFHDILFPSPRFGSATVTPTDLPVVDGKGRTLDHSEAVAFTLQCQRSESVHAVSSIVPETGPNLAAGRAASADINRTEIDSARSPLLTDGELGPRKMGTAVNSAPHTPGVELEARFTIELEGSAEINTVVLHHGTWNGGRLIYPPGTIDVQFWRDNAWHGVETAATTWGEDFVSTTIFEPVVTNRVSVIVNRPTGGRLALREFQIYRVADTELARVAALRKEQVTREWTDHILLSHTTPVRRTCGRFEFDGELAIVRCDDTGTITRVAIQRGKRLVMDGKLLMDAPTPVDELVADWRDDGMHVDTTAPAGLRIAAASARKAWLGKIPAVTQREGGLFVFDRPENNEKLSIDNCQVVLHPPQKDLHGGQRWAVVTWKTDRPATSQVEFGAGEELLRRTPLARRFVTEHRMRVEFLHPDREYRFQCVSIDDTGQRSSTACAVAHE